MVQEWESFAREYKSLRLYYDYTKIKETPTEDRLQSLFTIIWR